MCDTEEDNGKPGHKVHFPRRNPEACRWFLLLSKSSMQRSLSFVSLQDSQYAIEGRILSDANDIICVMFSFIVLSFCVHIDEVCQQGRHKVLSEPLLNRNSMNYRVTKYIQMEIVPIKSLCELT